MIGFLVRKIFGSKNDRFLKKLRPLVAKINALEPEMQALADEELPQRRPSVRPPRWIRTQKSLPCARHWKPNRRKPN